ncbi:Ribonuclease H-like superfamily [Sesbania bispinosa]|nr:Ribonuclease H-like superfamily [Sesbania bispinosa]
MDPKGAGDTCIPTSDLSRKDKGYTKAETRLWDIGADDYSRCPVMEFPDSETQPNRHKRRKSVVWEHFTVKTDESGCARLTVNGAKKSFAYIKDALWAMRETIAKVRESVKYVKSSQTHERKFFELRQQLQVPKKAASILAIAVAMDPRYKMKFVESTFAKIFGENAESWIRIVEDGLHELFLEYSIIQVLPYTETNRDEGNEAMIKTEPFQEGSFDGSLFAAEDGFSDVEFFMSDFTVSQQFTLELNEYLEEPLEPRVQEFDILSWWRINGFKYPTLSRMASDILSMPVSTLSLQILFFDTEIRKMDNYRSSLDSLTLEALICTKDWFRSESLTIDVSSELVKWNIRLGSSFVDIFSIRL